ncbi:hypothetical protein BsWGS_15612 [Bradybaena similaris]
MVDQLLGNWKLVSSDNFDEFMKVTKVNLVLRKIGNSISNCIEISRDGETWTIHITSTFRNQKLIFKLGETIDEKTLDGRHCKSTFSVEGKVLVQKQDPTDPSDVPSRFQYEVQEDGKLLVTCISIPTNVVAKRTYERYNP